MTGKLLRRDLSDRLRVLLAVLGVLESQVSARVPRVREMVGEGVSDHSKPERSGQSPTDFATARAGNGPALELAARQFALSIPRGHW